MAELNWDNPKPLEEVETREIADGGVPFAFRGYWYQSTGEAVGNGGMGTAYSMVRCPEGQPRAVEQVVGKVFHEEYLYQLRTDPITRSDHQMVVRSMERLTEIEHPNVLRNYIAHPIANNYLNVTPRRATTMAAAVVQHKLSPRQRVELLIQALAAVSCLHDAGMVHRDLTLRNILVDEQLRTAYLFDFDLTLSLEDIEGATYKQRYKGRIFGSPGYSVAPEILDPVLMDLPISEAIDIYAAGSAIFNLFTDELPYGPTEDMWGLLLRISEGLVFHRESRVVYPSAVPDALKPIIEGCLERNPRDRFGSMNGVIEALAGVLPELDADETTPEPRQSSTLRYGGLPTAARVKEIVEGRRDQSISESQIRDVDQALASHGYEIQRSLGRVKGHPIFLAAPIPELVAIGQFPDSNTYPKIVTALDLSSVPNPDEVVDLWLGGYLPILRAARQGLLTSLYRVVHDDERKLLFLFSEYVDDARFGTDLEDLDLTLYEALGLGYLVSCQVRRLHRRGMAHNNISARALLLKGVRIQRMVRPAMVGLVAPSLDPSDMTEDVRHLAELIASWIRQTRIESADEVARARLVELWSSLKDMIKDDGLEPPQISELIELMADGLSAIDFNFGVLRENDGDLQSYVLLLVSLRLYPRLFPG